MNDQHLLQEIEQLKRDMAELKASRGLRAFMKKAFMKTHVIVGIVLAAMITSFVIYAGTVSKPYTFTTGSTISASEVNSNFDTLYTLVNGNLDDNNISGISGSKINAGEVSADRLPSSVNRNIGYSRGLTNLLGANSGALLPVDSSYLPSVTLTTTGKPVRISFACLGIALSGGSIDLHVYMDGSSMASYMQSDPGFLAELPTAGATIGGTLAIDYIFTGIPAGSHTFTMYHRFWGTSNCSIYFQSGTFVVEELTSL